jgi:hypothetical protein
VESNAAGRWAYNKLRHISETIDTGKSAKDLTESYFVQARFHNNHYTSAQASVLWKSLGPHKLGGRTRALAVDIADASEQTILAGGVTGGVWKTKTRGKHWYRTSNLSETPSVSCLLQDMRSVKQQTWYYGTGEMFYINDLENDNGVIRGQGIFKSTNNGESWSPLSSTQSGDLTKYDNSFDYIWNLCLDTTNIVDDELYAATAGGIYRSIDGGATWVRVLGDGKWSGRYADVVISPTGILYATISNINGSPSSVSGIFRSQDGVTWESVTPPWWPQRFNRVVITLCPTHMEKLYAIADLSTENSKDHILAKYEHPGIWTNLSQNLPNYSYDLGDYDSQLSFNMVIRVSPANENIVFLGGTNLYRSDDGFMSRENIHWVGGYEPLREDRSKYSGHHPDQHRLLFLKNSQQMLSAHDGGISFTQNGMEQRVRWSFLNENYVTSQFYTVALNQGSADLQLIGGMQDNGSYGTENANTHTEWRSLLAGDGSYCAIANNGIRQYVSSQYGRIYRLDYDNNGKYTSFARVDPDVTLPYLFINPFILDPYNSNVMYLAGGTHVWRNPNLTAIPAGSDKPTAMNWRRMDETATSDIISALAASTEKENTTLYYGTSRGRVYRAERANTLYPQVIEITGTNLPKYFGRPVGFVSSITVDPFDKHRVLVTFSNYGIQSAYYTDNAGSTWNAVAGNLEEFPDGSGAGPAVYTSAMLQLSSGPYYFLGTSSGLFGTSTLSSAETQWEKLALNTVGDAIVHMITARQKDGTVVAATHGNGIFVTQYPHVAPFDFTPLLTQLHANYPNPFSSSQGTTIAFSIDEPQLVSLEVIDGSGKQVSVLLQKEMDEGNYSIHWNSTNAATGIYYCRLRSRYRTFIHRMVVR